MSFLKNLFGRRSNDSPVHTSPTPQPIDGQVTVKGLVDEGVEKKRQGDYAGARQLYCRAIELDPTERMTFWALAKICYLLGEQEASILNYLRATHLKVSGMARACRDEPSAKQTAEQSLLRFSSGTVAELRAIHPSAPYLLFDIDASCHIAHALVDLDRIAKTFP